MQITIEDGATPALKRLIAAVTKRIPMMEAAGRGVAEVLQAHFVRRDAEGNKQGWPRKHFWSRVVKDYTNFETATADEATVKIASREFRQKLYGGTLMPTTGKYLAIPLTARAYKAGRPRNWPVKDGDGSLNVVRLTGGRLLLRESFHSSLTGRKRDRGRRFEGGEAQYLLVRRIVQKPDPRALPSETMMVRAARIAVQAVLRRQS